MNERYIKPLILFAATLWAVIIYVNHGTLHPDFLTPLSTVTTAAVYAALAFDRWLWKLPLVRLWVKRPVIDGTWRVSLRSTWKSPETNEHLPPIDGFMVVRQTLSTLSMRLLTKESSSSLIGTEIVCAPDGLYCVSGVYRNEPRLGVRDRSGIHNGAILLQVENDRTTQRMAGHYWTDRTPQTAGEMLLSERISTKFGSFEAAANHYRSRQPVASNS